MHNILLDKIKLIRKTIAETKDEEDTEARFPHKMIDPRTGKIRIVMRRKHIRDVE